MWPPPDSRRIGVNALQPCTTPNVLISMMRCQESIEPSSIDAALATPALLTRMSNPPQASATWRAARSKSSYRVTSSSISSTCPPAARTFFAERATLSRLRPVTATRQPCRPKSTASASPEPLVAPVIRTRRAGWRELSRATARDTALIGGSVVWRASASFFCGTPT